jgi:actin
VPSRQRLEAALRAFPRAILLVTHDDVDGRGRSGVVARAPGVESGAEVGRMPEEIQGLVHDCGSLRVKAGFSGDDTARVDFENVVGRPRHQGVMVGMGQKSVYVGAEAIAKRGILTLRAPVERGRITQWDAFEQVLHHTFYNELRVAPEEHAVLAADAPESPKEDRERLTQMHFETFNVPGFYVTTTAALALYASGRSTGVVVALGGAVCHVVALYEGNVIAPSVRTLPLGGVDLDAYLAQLLTARGISLTTVAELEIVRTIKEQLCFVAEDFDAEVGKFQSSSDGERNFELPDGQVITITDERFRAPEALFKPTLIGLEADGIHQLVQQAILACDVDLRQELWGSVVLTGGSSLFPNIGARFQRELDPLAPSGTRVRIVTPPERRLSAWLGGSILSALSTSQAMFITRAEYDEAGPSVVHRKCP